MKTITLNLGGQLATGDVVGVSYNNCIVFGWYVESGQYGSLKYIPFRIPASVQKQYDDYMNGVNKEPYVIRKYVKGLQFKHFRRDYIVSHNSPHWDRAFKVPNPEEFFKGNIREQEYLYSREVLRNNKFPAK
jgi:hypothetical protein